jgi:hypothetical protein
VRGKTGGAACTVGSTRAAWLSYKNTEKRVEFRSLNAVEDDTQRTRKSQYKYNEEIGRAGASQTVKSQKVNKK